MDVQIAPRDGLLTIDDASAAEFLRLNPFDYHSQYHGLCRQVYAQVSAAAQPSPFEEQGFGVIKGFATQSAAAGLSQSFSTGLSANRRGANTLIEPSPEMKQQIVDLVGDAMARGAAPMIEGHLGSFFRIDHIDCLRTQRSETEEVSFRWHRDVEPMAQLHIMLYLTPSDENSAATIFTTLEDTRRLARLGYAYPPFEDRVHDINAWLPEGEAPVAEARPLLAAGDATMFNALRVAHRGAAPNTETHRDVVLLNVLPNFNSWEQELAATDGERLFQSRDTLWINPFAPGVPSLPDPFDPPILDWALQSHYFAK